jgi:hypothetical protein
LYERLHLTGPSEKSTLNLVNGFTRLGGVEETLASSAFRENDGVTSGEVKLHYANAMKYYSGGLNLLQKNTSGETINVGSQKLIKFLSDRIEMATGMLWTKQEWAERFEGDPSSGDIMNSYRLCLYREITTSIQIKNPVAASKAFHEYLAICKRASDVGNPIIQEKVESFVLVYGHLSDEFLKSGDFINSRVAAEAALALDDSQVWILGNLAHALLMSGEIDQAKAIYLRFRGMKIFPGQNDSPIWEGAAESDFKELKKLGLTHPNMEVIAKLLDFEFSIRG